jgi:tetratricopeptide (TPR) repeat protein
MSGHAALAQGQAEAAIPAFERAIADADSAEDPSLTAGLNTDLARALVAADRAPDAVAALAAAREADPANPQAWLLSATLARRLERLGEAQRHIEYAATLAPRDPAVGLEAGVIAAMAGRAEQARASFQSVIDVAPESVEAGRARTYLTRLDGGTQQTEPRGR